MKNSYSAGRLQRLLFLQLGFGVSQTTTLEIIAVPTSISKSKPTLTEVKIPPAASTLVTETNKPEQSEINGGSSVSNVGEPMDPDEP